MMRGSPTLYERLGGHDGIAKLLRHFYADVRQHQLIGPVFNARIKNWPEHIEKIGQFWARVTEGPSSYSGQMPLRHFVLNLEPPHFKAWLSLWDANCRCYLEPREAQEMCALAHDIGRRLEHLVKENR